MRARDSVLGKCVLAVRCRHCGRSTVYYPDGRIEDAPDKESGGSFLNWASFMRFFGWR